MSIYTITSSIELSNGATAKIFNDGDVLLETLNPNPYFVLTKADLENLVSSRSSASQQTNAPILPQAVSSQSPGAVHDVPLTTNGPSDDVIQDALMSSLKGLGYKPDDSYLKIYSSLSPFKPMSSQEIVVAAKISATKANVSDKLARLERCGFARRTQSGTGVASLWLRR